MKGRHPHPGSSPCELSLADAATAIASGALSSVELVASCLERIQAVDRGLRAFISVDGERALATARERDAQIRHGEPLGPLHGVPVGIKDSIDVAGLPTSAGSRVLAGRIAEEDAPVVARLRQAGAIPLGKTNMHELGAGGTSDNPYYGTVRNAWDPTRTPGGSSGGSATAVAARLCPAALGTDTGGSIRIPAAFNGLVGLRPTYGLVDTGGSVPLAHTMDTIGPLTRTVGDNALVLSAITVPQRPPPAAAPPTMRVATIVGLSLEEVQREVAAGVRAGLAALGAEGWNVGSVRLEQSDRMIADTFLVHNVEAAWFHARQLKEQGADFGEDVRRLLEAGMGVPATEYVEAQRRRSRLRLATLAALEEVDALVSPTVPFGAPPIGLETVRLNTGVTVDSGPSVVRFAGLASLTGLPALTVPCGFDTDGLPVGLQLIGRPFEEHTLYRLGSEIEAALGAGGWSPALNPT